MMKKKLVLAEEQRKEKAYQDQQLIDQEQREEDRIEIEETRLSKNLVSEMVKSALGEQSSTLHKVVDVLQNQNGKSEDAIIMCFRYLSFK